MSNVRMATGNRPARQLRGRAAVIQAVTLPTEPTIASDEFNDFHIMVHGEPKIGKSTLLTQTAKTLVLSFDPIRKSHKLIQVHIPDWSTFMLYLNKLRQAASTGNFPYDRVVVDGTDIWYRYCQTWACKECGVDHPNDASYGKGWDKLKETFADAVDKILALPCGVSFISHSQWKAKMTRNGGKDVEKLHPLMKDGGYEILVGKLDGAFAYDYYNRERVLILLGDELTTAGHTIKGHFLTTDGRLIGEVSMGNSEEEAWANFLAAWNNEQPYATLAERDEIAAKQQAQQRGGPRRAVRTATR
jgi:hypothetical protein